MSENALAMVKKAFALVSGLPEKSVSAVLTPFHFVCRGAANGRSVYGNVWHHEREDLCNVFVTTEIVRDAPYVLTPLKFYAVSAVSTGAPVLSED